LKHGRTNVLDSEHNKLKENVLASFFQKRTVKKKVRQREHMEYVKSTIPFRRTTSVELIPLFQPRNNQKGRSLSESDLNAWFCSLAILPLSIKITRKSQILEDFTIVWLKKKC
jgi:hypothetical protein